MCFYFVILKEFIDLFTFGCAASSSLWGPFSSCWGRGQPFVAARGSLVAEDRL